MDTRSHPERLGPAEAIVDGVRLAPGSRVRLRPKSRADILDLALNGRLAVVESVERDDDGGFHVGVTLAGDPLRDLGESRLPCHRFFYSAEELEPVGGGCRPRVLVAGIGNVFLGDDGFGVEVVRRLADDDLPADVIDFGSRGLDLAYALQRDYEAAILVDAAPRGEQPGTLTLLEPDLHDLPCPGGAGAENHGLDPVKVLRMARELGRVPERVLVLCCEPARLVTDDVLVELSEPVRGAVEEALRMVRSLVMDVLAERA
ncbi:MULTISPECIES: hydrogenase maturation protease [unclassified Nonomuraea]|uniref:hydrogenase maturation protease n=1 Tax=unclassified Nonomuraea TaxID=2593643 RepID=UPI00340FEF13